MKLIINADDMAYSQDVNDTIFDLMDKRKISSATVLAGGAALDDAVRRIKGYPGCSFGVHLYLTELRPLTNSAIWGKYQLLDDNENFNTGIRHCKRTDEIREAIFDEWCSQVDKLNHLQVQISHIDSHQHVHTIPWLFFILKRVQKKYNIRKVRKTLNLYDSSSAPANHLLFKKWLWNFMLANIYRTKVTRYFTKLDWFLRIMQKAPSKYAGTFEIMTHPGSDLYENDVDLLLSGWENYIPKSFELISYNEL